MDFLKIAIPVIFIVLLMMPDLSFSYTSRVYIPKGPVKRVYSTDVIDFDEIREIKEGDYIRVNLSDRPSMYAPDMINELADSAPPKPEPSDDFYECIPTPHDISGKYDKSPVKVYKRGSSIFNNHSSVSINLVYNICDKLSIDQNGCKSLISPVISKKCKDESECMNILNNLYSYTIDVIYGECLVGKMKLEDCKLFVNDEIESVSFTKRNDAGVYEFCYAIPKR